MPVKILTWRSQLVLAGGAGQRQALAESVHPVEADGDVGLRHGLQGFGGGEGELGGLLGQPGLGGLGMPWTAALQREGEGGGRGGGTHTHTIVNWEVKSRRERRMG